MKWFSVKLGGRGRLILWLSLAALVLGWLLLHKLGSLTGGLSADEVRISRAPVGWHGIYRQPFYLPWKVIKSVIFVIFTHHGQTLSRLPSVCFGALTIISFSGLIRLWHGTRTALLAGLLFATSAWLLHVSRLTSFDVLYLWALPTLLFVNVLLRKSGDRQLIWYVSALTWGMMLYLPGLVWLVGLNIILQREEFAKAWRRFDAWWQRLVYVAAYLVWLPLLVLNLLRPGNLVTWLGLPTHWQPPLSLLKNFAAVPVHLFVRGPEYPQLWLGKAPLLDAFTLAASLVGIYFYATHWQASRSRLLAVMAFAGWILVGLGGPVGFSLLVPLMYMAAATGIAYLLHEWLSVFPYNPLARGLGLGLIALAVSLSCVYNLRAYFVAWPHNHVTQATFHYRL